jgi:hypothetical protein
LKETGKWEIRTNLNSKIRWINKTNSSINKINAISGVNHPEQNGESVSPSVIIINICKKAILMSMQAKSMIEGGINTSLGRLIADANPRKSLSIGTYLV